MTPTSWGACAWGGWALGVLTVLAGYAWLAWRGSWGAGRAALFAAGCASTLAAAWGLHDPLQSMSAYAAALMLLGQGVSPLLLLGVPVRARTTWREPNQRWWARWLIDPWVAVSVFVLLTLALNLPGLFESALANAVFSAPIGVLLLIGGLMMWAQLLDGSRGIRRRWLAGLVGWLASLPMMLVAAVWVWSPRVLYMPYLDVLCLWNLSPLQDQHYAGLAMFVAGLPLQLRAAWMLIMGDASTQGSP